MTSTALTSNNVPGAYNEFGIVASGDFNKDGLTDLFWAKLDSDGRTSNTTNYIWLAKTDGTFTQSTAASDSSIPTGHAVVGVGDFNGDGLTDFYSYSADSERRSNGNGNDYVYVSKGDGSFNRVLQTAGITGSSHDEFKALATGDFNGDGISDIYVAKTKDDGPNKFRSTLYDVVFLGAADGIFTNVAADGPAATSYEDYGVQASGDFNGDGRTDFYLVCQYDDGRAKGTKSDSVWLAKVAANGSIVFSVATISSTLSLQNNGIVAGSGDFNGDGLTDLYIYEADDDVRAKGSDADYVALAKGDGSFEIVMLPGEGITGSSMDEYKARPGGECERDTGL
jgi:hypothetical protein